MIRSRIRSSVAASIAVVSVLTGCSGEDRTGATVAPRPPSTPTTGAPDDDDVGTDGQGPGPELDTPVTLIDLALDIEDPIAAAAVPGSSSVLVAARAGTVHEVVLDGDRARQVQGAVIDLVDAVGSTASERGLLGVAVSPDGSWLVASYTAAADGGSRIDRYRLGGTAGSLRAQADSRVELLRVEQPYSNHNGGHVAFGPDGLLYVGFGDGGSAGDPHGNGQDPTTLLGTLVRIDATDPGAVPPDNPFVGTRGGVRPEIWLTGVRNPWRFSFDAETGDLWVADVGQNRWEELNRLPAADGGGRGANLGWDLYEGAEAFDDADPAPSPWSDGPFVEPVLTYGRQSGCSVTGGVVYRGAAISDLAGAYLFADLCGRGVRALDAASPEPEAVELADAPLEQIVGFAETPDGEVLVISLSAGVHLLASA